MDGQNRNVEGRGSIPATWRLKMLTEGRLADSVWRIEDKDYSNAAARRPFISFMLHRVSLLLAQSGHANPGDERPSPLCPCGPRPKRFANLAACRGSSSSASLSLLLAGKCLLQSFADN